MESCKYHPITPSVFSCSHCNEEFCDSCVDHSVGGEAHCFLCGGHVLYHVTTDNVDPFWRRLEKAFKYPLNANAMMMVIGLSVVSALVAALPLGGFLSFIANLCVAGLTVNYAFLCLTATSEGKMEAPMLADAMAGSIDVLWKLFLMMLFLGLSLYAMAVYISPVLVIVTMVVLYIGLPAILMCFAHSNSVLDAVNPLNFVRLMLTVGVPYIVLVLFLFIMMTSVDVLNNFIGNEIPALAAILSTSVANYYAVVAFHLMGYLLYQYQDKLGFSTGDNEQVMQKAELADVTLAHVNVRLKEGDYPRAIELLTQALASVGKDKRLWQRKFDILYRTNNKLELASFADAYFQHLLESAQHEKLASDYKRVKQLAPAYLPEQPTIRLHIAHACKAAGDARSTVQLINGMHKQHEGYDKLVEAYQLMHTALQDLPNMEKQAQQCAKLIELLKSTAPKARVHKRITQESALPTGDERLVEKLPTMDIDETFETELAPIEFKP